MSGTILSTEYTSAKKKKKYSSYAHVAYILMEGKLGSNKHKKINILKGDTCN